MYGLRFVNVLWPYGEDRERAACYEAPIQRSCNGMICYH